jgi:ribosomal-protein-alanine N-acetyltransferase
LKMKIRPATAADIPSIMSLERECAIAAHWTEQQYRQALQSEGPERLLLVAEASPLVVSGPETRTGAGSDVLGFLVARHLAPEWELENIVVAPAARRKGLGKRFLGSLLALVVAREDTSSVILEVRESNAVARAFYENAGFFQIGRRRSYYANPSEDAILYRRTLS